LSSERSGPSLNERPSGSGRNREGTLDDAQAVSGEPQLADDFRIEEATVVGGCGIAKAGANSSVTAATADDRAALEHPYLETGRLERIARAQTTVVTGDVQCKPISPALSRGL